MFEKHICITDPGLTRQNPVSSKGQLEFELSAKKQVENGLNILIPFPWVIFGLKIWCSLEFTYKCLSVYMKYFIFHCYLLIWKNLFHYKLVTNISKSKRYSLIRTLYFLITYSDIDKSNLSFLDLCYHIYKRRLLNFTVFNDCSLNIYNIWS